ncbi:EAL and HDOD domain-containing protein [Planctobacterium marinum]|uniref:EAL and HDOD domain-containing protein n=1 Tax=Planctobacterium marinum TaxID=1631968 RepID=UPI001E3B7CFC|nr:HDOD domain-containing protein [Planctobacterium marinum]MCC2604957.1 HDOD domain-containing protein [Planctobacterium marinum]
MYTSLDVLCARQPIFDDRNRIFGYELLYRSQSNVDKADFVDDDIATIELILNTCGSINDDEALVQFPLFFNLTRNLLFSDSFFPVDANKAIIEILEDTVVDEALIKQIYRLKRLGYHFALDDFTFESHFEDLLPMVKYIKIDVLACNIYKHEMDIQRIKAMGKVLIAEKIESYDVFEQCVSLGFDLFQGYYLERPQLVEGRKINANVNLALTIINELQQPDVSFDKLSYLVSKDPKLSYQLLRILNSPAQGLKREVSSLKQAVVFLGIVSLKKWVILISLMQNSDVPDAFFTILLTRARTCELLAKAIELNDTDSYFTVGLFSGLDRVFNMELPEVIKHLFIPLDVQNALLNLTGFKGETLSKVMLLERADWDDLTKACGWSQACLLAQLMEQARDWTDSLLGDLE